MHQRTGKWSEGNAKKLIYRAYCDQRALSVHWDLRPWRIDCSKSDWPRWEVARWARRRFVSLWCRSATPRLAAGLVDRAGKATGWAPAARGSFWCRSGSRCSRWCRLWGRVCHVVSAVCACWTVEPCWRWNFSFGASFLQWHRKWNISWSDL